MEQFQLYYGPEEDMSKNKVLCKENERGKLSPEDIICTPFRLHSCEPINSVLFNSVPLSFIILPKKKKKVTFPNTWIMVDTTGQ